MDRTQTPDLEEIEVSTQLVTAQGRTREDSHATVYTFRTEDATLRMFVKTTGRQFVRFQRPSDGRTEFEDITSGSVDSSRVFRSMGIDLERDGHDSLAKLINTLYMDFFRWMD